MAQIVWTNRAIADLDEIPEYIALDNLEAAIRVAKRVVSHVVRLSKHPLIGSIIPELADEHFRQIVEPPVRIFYRFDGTTVYILHVLRFERLLRLSYLEED
jgi:plasmid stabilization system protein ParE